jgi:hypothetical protein
VDYEQRAVFGPFHRLLAPDVQDAPTMVKQLLSGELWGRAPRSGGLPRAKAYPRRLPHGASGFEFWAFQAPDIRYGARRFWYSAGPYLAIDVSHEVVRLQIAFVRITQDLHILAP